MVDQHASPPCQWQKSAYSSLVQPHATLAAVVVSRACGIAPLFQGSSAKETDKEEMNVAFIGMAGHVQRTSEASTAGRGCLGASGGVLCLVVASAGVFLFVCCFP